MATIDWSKPSDRPAFDKKHSQQHEHHWRPHLHSQEHRRSSSVWSRRSSGRLSERRPSLVLQRTQTGKRWWKFTLRDWDDDEDQDWWFASTAIPLLAATLGPLANVFSIAALVTSWRMCLVEGVDNKKDAAICSFTPDVSTLLPHLDGHNFDDPKWCLRLNLVSLIVGFIGNFFLLCNFTNRIRYIIALPVTIVMWYVATGLLIGITVSMEIYKPPIGPQQTYTQGFWYAVIAAFMYMICSMMLMVNMLGYFLGHYQQHFTLTDSQRTLILQTMLFFVWLAGGGAVFSRVEQETGNDQNWSFSNALYFCDVTILTVGFGDLYPQSDAGRGLVFPYSVGGIIMLGLMVSSISKFASELSSEKIIRRHVERSRARTIGRTVTNSMELEEHRRPFGEHERPVISPPLPHNPNSPHNGGPSYSRSTTINIADDKENWKDHPNHSSNNVPFGGMLRRVTSTAIQPTKRRRSRKTKLILLREEKDRFDAMRHIQYDTTKFKRWYALFMSVCAFGLLWNVGAVVFWQCEKDVIGRDQKMTYFRALYFCYVSLLTIGYGDLAPISNPGRPFFVFWSLIAVPTMTILVSDLGETVINKFKKGTFRLADFTVLPKSGVWREIVDKHPWLLNWLQQRKDNKEAKKRLEDGFPLGPEPEPVVTPTIDDLAKDDPTHAELAGRLPTAIRQMADDMMNNPKKKYSYEEWVDLTRLIRFTAKSEEEREMDDEENDLIEWDWIGEDSPMMSKGSEAEFVLDRLLESMNRYIKQVSVPQHKFRKIRRGRSPNDDDDLDGITSTSRVGSRVTSRDGPDIGPHNEQIGPWKPRPAALNRRTETD